MKTNKKFKQVISFAMALGIALSSLVSIGSIETSYASEPNIVQLKDVPIGSTVYDPTWEWEFRTGSNYTGSGNVALVEWIVVAKNHANFQRESVTLVTNKVIGAHVFDNSYDNEIPGKSYFGKFNGLAEWGKSGNGNATKGIRKWLNGSSYEGNDNNSYEVTFYDSFSDGFKNIILETDVENIDVFDIKTKYTTTDKIFIPSTIEFGGGVTSFVNDGNTYEPNQVLKIGTVFEYFKTNIPPVREEIFTRGGATIFPNSIYIFNGELNRFVPDKAQNLDIGVVPALNLKSDTLVKFVDVYSGQSRYEIVYGDIDSTSPLDEAIEAVELVETTKSQEDLDTARDLVNQLPDGQEKIDLNNRLDNVQKEIDAKKAHEKKVQEIEDKINNMTDPLEATDIQEDIDSLLDGEDKNRLQEELNNKIEELENTGSEDNLQEATEAVELAETTKTQVDVDTARALVTQLPDGQDKTDLNNRLDAIQTEIDDKIAHDNKVQEIEDKISNMTDPLEATEIQEDIDSLPDGADKDRLQEELNNKVEELVNNGNENALTEATEAVEKVETTLTETDYNKAKDLVDALPDGKDKTELQDRLDIVKDKIDHKDEIKDLIDNLDSLDDLTAIEDLINSIEDEDLKSELQDLLNNKTDEIEEAKELQKAIDEATVAVELAETTKAQEDVDTARALVDSLPTGSEKTSLTNRLDKIQADIDYQKALKEATEAVKVAEGARTQESVNSAYTLVNKLPNGADKSNLVNRLKAVEAEILAQLAKDKAEKEAIRAVELAESLKRESYIQEAKDKVATLENIELKEVLEERLLRLEEGLNSDSEAVIKSAIRFVELAETLKRDPHITNAKNVVNNLKPGETKTTLLLRIESIAGALTEDAKALIEATTYVETAEKYGYSSIIRQAEVKVNALKESVEKTALIQRLDALK